MTYKISLVGNPNVGKTSIFNALTKSFEHVGNWHGVTVKSAKKAFKYKEDEIELEDLPGIYSLTAYSNEETVSRDSILAGGDKAVVNICEVNNLPRNLYLALQLAEAGVPFVLAVNMVDELKKIGKTINYDMLSQRLGVPVLPVSAKLGQHLTAMVDEAVALNKCKAAPEPTGGRLPYLEKLPIKEITAIIGKNAAAANLDARFAAIKVMERDGFIIDKLNLSEAQAEALKSFGDTQSALSAARYEHIAGITCAAVVDIETGKAVRAHGESALDKVLLNKYAAIPIFIGVMAAIFLVTFGLLGKLMTDGLEWLIENGIQNPVVSLFGKWNVPEWITALLSDGVIGGVGGILVFLPQVALLFLFLAIMEDSGYMSRVAFMTDGIFRKAGLTGRSSFTLLMGFGCSATAVLTARNLESPQARRKTVLLTPFMSCSARLPVYVVVGSLFFLGSRPFLIFGLYALGIAVMLLWSFILEKIPAFKSPKNASFIMEMPPYRLPSAKRVARLLWDNVRAFIVRIGTVIFAMSVIVWLFSNFSFTFKYVTSASDRSMLAVIAGALKYIFAPLGFGNWRAAVALLSGLVAKEVVVSSITTLGGAETILGAGAAAPLAFLVFVLLYVPCVATIASVGRELGWKWAVLNVVMQLVTAYVFSLIVYWLAVFFTNASAGVIIGTVITTLTVGASAVILLKAIKSRTLFCAGCPELKNCKRGKEGKCGKTSRQPKEKTKKSPPV